MRIYRDATIFHVIQIKDVGIIINILKNLKKKVFNEDAKDDLGVAETKPFIIDFYPKDCSCCLLIFFLDICFFFHFRKNFVIEHFISGTNVYMREGGESNGYRNSHCRQNDQHYGFLLINYENQYRRYFVMFLSFFSPFRIFFVRKNGKIWYLRRHERLL